MTDHHLVLNVLNLMAARDFKERGVEDPVLFALSGYLRESFRHAGMSLPTLADEFRLLEAQLSLQAIATSSELDIELSCADGTEWKAPAGMLAALAGVMFGAVRPKTERRASFTLKARVTQDLTREGRGDVGGQTLAIEMRLGEASANHLLDAGLANARLAKVLEAAGVSPSPSPSPLPPPQVTQRGPRELGLDFSLATFARAPT